MFGVEDSSTDASSDGGENSHSDGEGRTPAQLMAAARKKLAARRGDSSEGEVEFG
jgi:hypothetical protein